MARQEPRAALPYTPGVGAVLLPPIPSGISAENFQLPSLISQVRPFTMRTLETAVSLPIAGFRLNAFLHLSTAIFIFSVSFIIKFLKTSMSPKRQPLMLGDFSSFYANSFLLFLHPSAL